jgi:UDP-galactopyranose mutase
MAKRDVVCLSHLPWAHALERPHQVMRRFARDRQVFFVEEPLVVGTEARTVMRTVETNVHVVSVQLASDTDAHDIEIAQRQSLDAVARETDHPLLWVYSPSALRAARDLEPSLLVYDCVADHGARRGADATARPREMELLKRADLVFTGTTALFEMKREHNVSTYPLPSSVDAAHFLPPTTLARSSHAAPRVGFLGTIDERIDLGIVDSLAAARPDVHVALLGGLVGVGAWELPDRPNVHHLDVDDDRYTYAELPREIASWDIAIIPFRNDAATRMTESSGLLACIAAGKPIVTTPLDEMLPYAEANLVRVMEPTRFVAGVESALREANDPELREQRAVARDTVLARTSWDRTCKAMMHLVDEAAMARVVAKRRVS